MDAISTFAQERQGRLDSVTSNEPLADATKSFLGETIKSGYSYNFEWLGRPIIQYPQDIAAMQELVWAVKPDLIIETGIAHGGSLILSASLLALLDYCDAVEAGTPLDVTKPARRVLGIDIDIRAHNRAAIEAHPLANRITMLQGSSVAPEIVDQVREYAAGYKRIMICLDSNHTHDHVLAELEVYAPLTSVGSYCIVFDTVVEDLPDNPDRPWKRGNNPKTAMREYLKRLQAKDLKAQDGKRLVFAVDKTIENKLLITVAPEGYLRRTDA